MKIAVTGAGGQLGSELVRQGCLPLKGRLMSEAMRYNIEAMKPDAIINCAAMTNVDRCQSNFTLAASVNAGSVAWFSDISDCYLVQISTDYIFDGRSGPYGVRDAPNPISVYGWSKLGGELAVRTHRGPSLIVRTTNLFSATNNNFVAKIVKQLRDGHEVTLFNPDLLGTPTYVPALATEIIRQVKEEYTGISHVVGNKQLTRLSLAQSVATLFGYDCDLIQPREADMDNVAPRPLMGGLICDHSGYRPVKSHDVMYGLKELAGTKGIFDEWTMERMGAG